MTNNSIESLLAWMSEGTRTYEWDAIIALSGDGVNQGLQQQYARRLSEGESWRLPDAVVPIPGTHVTHYFHDVQVGPPCFTFAQAGLDRSDTSLRLPVLGGVGFRVANVAGIKEITRVAAFDPLNGPQLRMDMQLASQTSGVGLDLAQGEDVVLDFSPAPAEQRAAGDVFKAWLQGQDSARRSWPVARLPEADNPFMTCRQISLRTQARPGQTQALPHADQDGALLLFARMEHGIAGGYPGQDSDFRYLIPDDEQQRCAVTTLLSSHLLHRAALGEAMSQLADDVEFEYQAADSSHQGRMIARQGHLQVPASAWHNNGQEFECDAFTLQAADGAGGLRAEFNRTVAVQTLRAPCTVTIRHRPEGSSEDWQSSTGTFNVHIEYEFYLSEEPDESAGMLGNLFAPLRHVGETSRVSGLENTDPVVLTKVEGFLAYVVKQALLGRFARTLNIAASQRFIDTFQTAGGQALQPVRRALPHDHAAFNALGTAGQDWQFVEQQPRVAAGESLMLQTEPPRSGLSWRVDTLAGSNGDPGTIDQQGLYQAPLAEAMASPASQVLVTASEPSSGATSTVLLTVFRQPLAIDPLIQVCSAGERVSFSGLGLQDGDLTWSLVNPVPDESGSLEPDQASAGACAYQAGAQLADRNHVIDEVQVLNASTGHARSAWVLVRHQLPLIFIEPEAMPGDAVDQLQLYAYSASTGNPVNAVWSLPLQGPGSIDENGLYHADPTASEAFVLVVATRDSASNPSQAYLILPLPLQHFPALIDSLSRRTRP
ncbi:hypothetical protein [Pseudomonas ovata]|uniref:hypothetical protein n=1 Tax=Pseudomonas ovata TaxID=1839709 RepID=UPI0012602CF9|nr:hypothetical protein [Pseudomonas ovata]